MISARDFTIGKQGRILVPLRIYNADPAWMEEWSDGREGDVCLPIAAFDSEEDPGHSVHLDSGETGIQGKGQGQDQGNDQDQGQDQGQGQGVNLVSVIVPIAVLACCIIVGFWLWSRKRRQNSNPSDVERDSELDSEPIVRSSFSTSSTVRFEPRFSAVGPCMRSGPRQLYHENTTLLHGEGSVRAETPSKMHHGIIPEEVERVLGAIPSNWEDFGNNPYSAHHCVPGIGDGTGFLAPPTSSEADLSSISGGSPPRSLPDSGSSSWSEADSSASGTLSPSLTIRSLPCPPSLLSVPSPPPTPSSAPPLSSTESSASPSSPLFYGSPPTSALPESGRQWKSTTSEEHAHEIQAMFLFTSESMASFSSKSHHDEVGRH
ncbi:unnamed protein product [Darwinula stevensoni]|uniref:Uncharacterized protein n=1 Tax=Darwinula stevensoni TaxID=69355 RepID=A0A7R9A2K6_9CRUS|nr:unnamed protein product [Darwinula stevensoni]CAG0885856.1 unnamed protein product [Darwinula stevensoni]